TPPHRDPCVRNANSRSPPYEWTWLSGEFRVGISSLVPVRSDAFASAPLAGRYAVERLLAKGGMGCVWLARDERLDRTLVLAPRRHGRREAARGRGRGRVRRAAPLPPRGPHAVEARSPARGEGARRWGRRRGRAVRGVPVPRGREPARPARCGRAAEGDRGVRV